MFNLMKNIHRAEMLNSYMLKFVHSKIRTCSNSYTLKKRLQPLRLCSSMLIKLMSQTELQAFHVDKVQVDETHVDETHVRKSSFPW